MNLKRSFFSSRSIVLYVLLGVILAFFLFPVYWMILCSFYREVSIRSYPPKFVAPLTLSNYYRTVFESSFVKSTGNTLVLSGVSTLIGIICGVPAAYALCKIKKRGIALLILTSRMIPLPCFLIPWFTVLSTFNLVDTFLGVSLTYCAISLPLITWIMMGFCANIPRELEEAAVIDGCSKYSAFFRIILRLIGPGVASAALLSFAEGWNNFMIPLILSGPRTEPLPIVISRFRMFYSIELGDMFATAVLMSIPVFFFAFACQKHLLSGLMGSAYFK